MEKDEDMYLVVFIDSKGRSSSPDFKRLLKTSFVKHAKDVLNKGVGTIEIVGKVIMVVYKERGQKTSMEYRKKVLTDLKGFCESNKIVSLYAPLHVWVTLEGMSLESAGMLFQSVFNDGGIKVVC